MDIKEFLKWNIDDNDTRDIFILTSYDSLKKIYKKKYKLGFIRLEESCYYNNRWIVTYGGHLGSINIEDIFFTIDELLDYYINREKEIALKDIEKTEKKLKETLTKYKKENLIFED